MMNGPKHRCGLGGNNARYGRAADLEEALFKLRGASKCLLKDIKIEFAPSKETGLSGVQLLKINVPTFDGKALNWKSFWE